jgi:hypothetical protein
MSIGLLIVLYDSHNENRFTSISVSWLIDQMDDSFHTFTVNLNSNWLASHTGDYYYTIEVLFFNSSKFPNYEENILLEINSTYRIYKSNYGKITLAIRYIIFFSLPGIMIYKLIILSQIKRLEKEKDYYLIQNEIYEKSR